MAESEVRRGDIYAVDLARAGSTLLKQRPVLIVQNDVGNRYSPETIVVAIRDPHGGRMLPIFVPIPKGVGGLAKPSIVDAGHINTIPKSLLRSRIGSLPASYMDKVVEALRVSLGFV